MENIFIRDESNTFKNLLSSSEEPKNTTIIARKGIINNKGENWYALDFTKNENANLKTKSVKIIDLKSTNKDQKSISKVSSTDYEIQDGSILIARV